MEVGFDLEEGRRKENECDQNTFNEIHKVLRMQKNLPHFFLSTLQINSSLQNADLFNFVLKEKL